MKRTLSQRHRSRLSLLLFIAPFTILFFGLFLYPLLKGVALSFTDWNGINPKLNFVGLKNYFDLFTQDSRFRHSLAVTGVYSVVNVAFSNLVGLGLALIVERAGRVKNFLRTAFFLPYVFSLVVVGFTWKLIYTKVFPNLFSATGLSLFDLDFLGDPRLALTAVLIMAVWQGVGYYLIIYIAGLQSVDVTLLEAAAIDGAGPAQKFIRVTLPMLMPSITICVFTSIADSLKVFDAIFVLTSGGPGYATEAIALNIYNEAFGSANLYGYGMAKAVVLALIIMVISFFQLRFFKSKEVES